MPPDLSQMKDSSEKSNESGDDRQVARARSSSHKRVEDKRESLNARESDSASPSFCDDRHVFFHSNSGNDNRENGRTSLTALKELGPNEMLLEISEKNSSFQRLFSEREEVSADVAALVFRALGKVCSSDLEQTLRTFFNFITTKADFLLIAIQVFLVSLHPGSIKDYHIESLYHLLLFLQKFQYTLPSSASTVVFLLFPFLRIKCEILFNHSAFKKDIMDKLKDIEEQNECLSLYTKSGNKKSSKRKALQPPENFRSLSILPNVDDLYSDAFLRPNIVKGKYCHTEHYLDIQYRLLREDYVKPLRDGIVEYRSLKKSVGDCQDARVYENVRIVGQKFVNGSLLHVAQLSGEHLSEIDWESSRSFLTGSLLCLSSDDFKTMLFASVARRIPEKLKNGLLQIRFEEISDEVLNLSPSRQFVLIETPAYFEAYRHNLKALQELDEQSLPLKQYIIHVKTHVGHPRYLDRLTAYDMRPLLVPMVGNEPSLRYGFPAACDFAKSVSVLSEWSWPRASDLNLDNSQYLALKAALTREFAIIQGPPGTGKTYIGLRIVQLLLHNIDEWFRKETNSLPILVVCFTNHALDQFLEGMMSFTHKIVRIGGRVSNEAVCPFQLNNVKKIVVQRKELPQHISTELWLKNQEIKCLKKKIDESNSFLQKCQKDVLGERYLANYIPSTHYLSLKSVVGSREFREHRLIDDDFIIHDWLGIRSRFTRDDFQNLTEAGDEVRSQLLDHFESAVHEMESIGGKADVEGQRHLNAGGFEEVSFDIENREKEEFIPSDNYNWKRESKQRLEYIKNSLNNSKALEETEASKISNLWYLDSPQRWNLYKYWFDKLVAKKREECLLLQAALKTLYQELCETNTEADLHVLMRAQVVGITTTGAAKYRNIVRRLNPQILIVEEAAEILESHVVTSLAPNTQHVILIGDHQQLRPSPAVHELAVKYGMNISLFERMIRNKMDYFKLSTQHRMRPEVTDLIVPHIYEDLKNHPSVTQYENIKGVDKNVFFVAHDHNEGDERNSSTKSNRHEATFIVKLCNYLVQQGYDSSQVTVLTAYYGQLLLLKKIAKEFRTIKNVRFTVVDNYQGEENDIILVSFVRSNEDGEIGFLKVANRVCVALSRARKGLYCIGNFELFAQRSDLWKNITHTLKQKGAIGHSLRLSCQNHPGVCNEVSNEKDFESVQEGGCNKMCDYRLPCGHICPLMCHPYDQMHSKIHCFKKCERTCKEGHTCPKNCYEKCGPCEVLVSCKVSPCGHTVQVPCSKQHSITICADTCDRKLICGHTCPMKCSEICAKMCREIISVKSSICGHVVSVECCKKNSSEELTKNCYHPCNAVLECGHRCNGNCRNCHQGRLHVACDQPCKRILVCGHECQSQCAQNCEPCKLPCENRCVHSKCPRQCGEPCDACTEECEYRCRHGRCSRLCGDICDRDACSEPCGRQLRCGHPCIGFCGEPCPAQCRVCDGGAVREIFFGTEDEEGARFVRLEDCDHVLEVSGLNEWMRPGDGRVQMKACPKCKTVIRTNLRFGNVVKDCLRKIEKVKQKTFGTVDGNRRLQNRLLTLVKANAMVLLKLRCGPFSLYESWNKILTSDRCRSVQEISLMENAIRFSLQLANLQLNATSNVDNAPAVKEGVSLVSNFAESSKVWLVQFMQNEILTASEQQLEQLSWEVHRLKLSSQFLNFTRNRIIESKDSDFEECVRTLTKHCSFEESSAEDFSNYYRALRRTYGSTVIKVSEMEKESILKAMDLSLGHWYQCPNGHVYCITECGGAMEESRCNECDAKIGGSNHELLSNNSVATDMDGATHSAWSNQYDDFLHLFQF